MQETLNKLPKRLAAVMALIPENSPSVADIGYDHGKIIKRLAVRDSTVRIIGVERQENAADRFWSTRWERIQEARTRIDLRCGDGATALQPGEAGIAVFSGLSEGNIVRMLTAAPRQIAAMSRLVFCPIDCTARIRPWLFENGWRIADEKLAHEHRRFSLAFAAEKGRSDSFEPGVDHFAPLLFAAREPLLYTYLKDLKTSCGPLLRIRIDRRRRFGNSVNISIKRWSCRENSQQRSERKKRILPKYPTNVTICLF